MLSIDRIAADRPCSSGKKRHHGVVVQVLIDRFGRLLWALPALPGSTHGLTAAREHGIVGVLAAAGPKCRADRDHQGVGPPGPGAVPGRAGSSGGIGTTAPPPRSAAPANKPWLRKGRQLLRKPCRSTHRITDTVKSAVVLHHTL
ncbi:hypothetical protein ACFYW1_13465 [Streptomyces sp. NPDC002669]|uniref:hypothetical protein n=1 Tax=Streptomyces sp. NPDC002669 TaxID=3364658 RepID=UPI0036C4FAA0